MYILLDHLLPFIWLYFSIQNDVYASSERFRLAEGHTRKQAVFEIPCANISSRLRARYSKGLWALAGHVYLWRVKQCFPSEAILSSSHSLSFPLCLSADDVPPYFKTEPVPSQLHLERNRLVLTCMAEGSWPLEFKWIHNDTEITRFSLEYRSVFVFMNVLNINDLHDLSTIELH